MLGNRFIILRNLVALGEVGVEVMFAVKFREFAIVQPSVWPILTVKAIAVLFGTGSVPGARDRWGDVCVWFFEFRVIGARTKHFALGFEFNVDFIPMIGM